MAIRVAFGIGLLIAAFAIGDHALAADEIAPLPGLDECVAAALKQRPGVLWGWKELGTGYYKISVITSDGKIGDADCSSSNMTDLRFETRFGLRRFEPYERIQTTEAAARPIAALIFAGRVRITGMEIDTDFEGNLRYEYSLVLQSGHKVKAQVSTVTGLLKHAEVKE